MSATPSAPPSSGSAARELLLELFSEEIPARMQARAEADLTRLVADGLAAAGVTHGPARSYATPRRLTLVIEDVIAETPSLSEELKGPRTDAPEKALDGFLRKTGLRKDQLEARPDKKGEVWFARIEKPGRRTADVLAELVPAVIEKFPWPKSMRWGSGELRWVRPLRSILCILSDGESAEVPDFKVGGIPNGDTTYGHRFMARDRKTGVAPPIRVSGFADYAAGLKKAKVMLDPAERAKKIEREVRKLAKADGLELVSDPGLLREVAGLVEHPAPLVGGIDAPFLTLPPEVLQTSMREHQKFFSLRNPASGQIEKFATVANIAAPDKGATIVAGNERVLRARLSDAEFFYRNDLAKPLEQGVEKLAAVTFHNQLGSQADRVARIRAMAAALAPLVGAEPESADRAALLAKADLVTEMVYEFPELQGLMGRYYAEAAGEAAPVAAAIESHYAPLGPKDAVPTEPVAIAVALADKLDQLAGFWTIGAKPTGSGDPFALRRAALGVIRIVLENGLRLRLGRALAGHAARLEPDVAAEVRRGEEVVAEGPAKSLDEWRAKMADDAMAADAPRLVISRRLFDERVQADLLGFFADRLKVYLRDQGVRYDVIDAVAGVGASDDLVRFKQRVDALGKLLGSADGENLLAGYKRAARIVEIEEKKDGVEYGLDPVVQLMSEPAEKALTKALETAAKAAGEARKAEKDAAAMAALAKLRKPLDAFFEGVTVNADVAAVRRNRLCLLAQVKRTMGQTADFSALEGG